MGKWRKSLLIGLGALLLSTLLVRAGDTLRGIEGSLPGLAIQSAGVCGEGATEILLGSHALCVDTYEESAGEQCPHADPQSQVQTQDNANAHDCKPASKKGAMPWRYVSLTQAQQFCARGGKRLPSNDEWYKTASGMSDLSSCVISKQGSEPALTGSTACVTPAGVYDMVGNVWEWVDGEVDNGTYNDRAVPEKGYVALVDASGVVLQTAATGSPEFGEDYAWTSNNGVYGMIRGGFYGSGSDAGIFAQNLSVPLDFRSTGVGFRCVKDL